MGILQLGTHVETYRTPDGGTQVLCPSCGHYIPDVPKAALTIDERIGRAEWLDCACMEGKGLPKAAGVPITGCSCVARFALRPSGTAGRYLLAMIDLMEMRKRERMHAFLAQYDAQQATAEEAPQEPVETTAPKAKKRR